LNPLKIDWPSLIKSKKIPREKCLKRTENHFVELGIDTYHGRAYFENQNTIVVGKDKLKGGHIFLATGAKPRKIDIPGEEYIVTSKEFMEIEKLPERIIFIGGVYISLEFAHVALRAVSEVTILHRSERLLRHFDADMVNMLIEASRSAGIKILTNKPVIRVEKEGNEFLVRTEFKSGTMSETQCFRADMIVHGASRVLDIEDLHLEKAGINIKRKGIAIDKHMRTSNLCRWRLHIGGYATYTRGSSSRRSCSS
jgi:glutathione reductase (NADPH)